MPDLILHGLPPSTYVRTARMICAAKGVDYTLQLIDFRDPEYLALHPFARMPVLTHGTVHLYETLAIAVYIDEAFEGPSLQPKDPEGKARMLQWISVMNDYAYERLVRCCVHERFVKPMRGQDPDEAKIAAAAPSIEATLSTLDVAARASDWLAGDAMSLADLFLAPILHYFAATPEGKAMLPNHPALQAWMSRVKAAPDYTAINQMGT